MLARRLADGTKNGRIRLAIFFVEYLDQLAVQRPHLEEVVHVNEALMRVVDEIAHAAVFHQRLGVGILIVHSHVHQNDFHPFLPVVV